jgi:hypothetical protein
MELDDTIARVKQLISQRDAINEELAGIFQGQTPKTRKPQQCSVCGSDQHSKRTCPQAQEQTT